MSKKSKCDVLRAEIKLYRKFILSFMFKMFSCQSKLKKGKISEDEFFLEIVSNLDKLIPLIEVISHIGYENNKDLSKIDRKELFNILESKKVNLTTFAYNYNKNIEIFTKVLLFFALIDKENIALPKFNNSEIALQLLNGDNLENVIFELIDSYDEEIDKLSDVFSGLDVNDMDEEYSDLIESYHSKFMNSRIYPFVTASEVQEKDVIKLARVYGSKTKLGSI